MNVIGIRIAAGQCSCGNPGYRWGFIYNDKKRWLAHPQGQPTLCDHCAEKSYGLIAAEHITID